jgi:hypothetical protein
LSPSSILLKPETLILKLSSFTVHLQLRQSNGWAFTLNKFLGCDFAKWAHDNPDIWGYEFGGRMWHSKTAFGVADHERLTHDLIIVRLQKVFNRWIVLLGVSFCLLPFY